MDKNLTENELKRIVELAKVAFPQMFSQQPQPEPLVEEPQLSWRDIRKLLDLKYKGEILNRLYMARLKAELNQSQLADKLCITSEMMSSYERGKKTIPLATLVRLKHVLGISLDEIFDIYDTDREEKIHRMRGTAIRS